MGQQERAWTTVAIWAAVAAILIATVSQSSVADQIDIEGLAAILMIGAAFGTFGVWRGAQSVAVSDAGKAKRQISPRVERLMDELDDEEVVQLQDLLDAQEERRYRE